MRSRKLLALLLCLITFPAIAGYMTLLGAGVGAIAPTIYWTASSGVYPTTYLTSARTSQSILFDSTNKATYAPNNVLTYSNTFNDASWSNNVMTVTSGVSDPDGGTNAWTLTAAGANAYIQKIVAAGPVQNAVAAIYMKRRTGTGNVQLYKPNGTGNVVSINSNWQLIDSTAAVTSSMYLRVQINTSADAIDIYIASLSAVTYETSARTNDRVVTTTTAFYGYRIDYTNGSAALLNEEARTNIVLWNRDLTNAAWVKGATATVAKDQTGLDGVTNSASSFTGGASSATNTVLQTIVMASSTRAQSAWVKCIVCVGAINMTTDGGATWNAITITLSWTRVQFSQTGVTNPTVGFQIITLNDKIAVDFVQNESDTYATSPIQTGALAVTRTADIIQFTGSALTTIQNAAGSVLIQMQSYTNTAPAANTNIIKGTNAILYRDTANKLSSTNGTTVIATSALSSWNNLNRLGLAWSAAGRSIGYLGGSVVSDGNLVNNAGTIYLGSNNGSAAENGWYYSLSIYNQRISDSNLIN